MKSVFFYLFFPLNLFSLFLIFLYKGSLSLLLRNTCRFYPSCSTYAYQAFKKKVFFTAFILVVIRLSKCHPLYEGDCIDELRD